MKTREEKGEWGSVAVMAVMAMILAVECRLIFCTDLFHVPLPLLSCLAVPNLIFFWFCAHWLDC